MRQRLFLLVALLLPILVFSPAQPSLAQGDPSFVTTFTMGRSELNKFPSAATSRANVYIAGNAEERIIRLWSKADTANATPVPLELGLTNGRPDFTSAAVFADEAGTIHVAWSDNVARRVYIRSQFPGGSFGPQLTVSAIEPFPVEVQVAAMEDGVFVFWREPEGPIRYRRSADALTWNGPSLTVFGQVAMPTFSVAAGPGRRMALGSTHGIGGEHLSPFVSLWDANSQNFFTERIPTPTNQTYANPSISLKPDGGYLTAFRNDDESPNVHGVYISERGPLGGAGWNNPGRINRSRVSTASATVDAFGNVHLYWVSSISGAPDLYYAFRRPNQEFDPRTFQGIGTGGSAIFNLDTASNVRDRSYGHAVAERFTGTVSRIQYYLFALPLPIPPPTAVGLILANESPTTNQATISATLTGIAHSPNQIRWRWGQPPLETDTFVAFDPITSTLTVGVPTSVEGNCTPLTLFTQLRRGTPPVANQEGTNSATILIDRGLQVVLDVIAPGTLDPRYTRSPDLTVLVNTAAECSGLMSGSVSGPLVGGTINMPLNPPPIFTQPIQVTGDIGSKLLTFTGSDRLGNSATVTRTIFLDPIPPILVGAADETTTTLVPGTLSPVLLSLDLRSLEARDENGILAGLVIQAQLTPATSAGDPPATPMIGRELIIPFTQLVVTTNSDGTLNLVGTLDLARFFPSNELVPGTYRFQIGVADGAGNRSERASDLVLTEELDRIGFGLFIPQVRR
ncbi:MAG: hypothetical protein AB4911_14635 [Oscillochloridaceae bacterium umkhey_bin13]